MCWCIAPHLFTLSLKAPSEAALHEYCPSLPPLFSVLITLIKIYKCLCLPDISCGKPCLSWDEQLQKGSLQRSPLGLLQRQQQQPQPQDLMWLTHTPYSHPTNQNSLWQAFYRMMCHNVKSNNNYFPKESERKLQTDWVTFLKNYKY